MHTNPTLTVLVKYAARPNKGEAALSALRSLVAEVKREPHYINISILVDPENASNILLLEEWSNEDYYKGEHMGTEHLQRFIKASPAFMAGPPEIAFWKYDSQKA